MMMMVRTAWNRTANLSGGGGASQTRADIFSARLSTSNEPDKATNPTPPSPGNIIGGEPAAVLRLQPAQSRLVLGLVELSGLQQRDRLLTLLLEPGSPHISNPS